MGVTAAAAALRAVLAWYDHSTFWPDEIYQSLEQAHRAVFGYGLISWEFRDGARNWLFPGAIAAIWKVAAGVGVESSITLVLLARLTMVASSVMAIWYAAKLAAVGSGARAGLIAAVILATFPPSVVFAYRAMSETASAPLIVLGAWLLTQRSTRSASYAGLALATACLLRYQNGLFVLVFAAALPLQRRWREVLAFCGSGALVAALGGLLDWVTWGRPFHSLLTYVDFNLIRGGASTFGVEPISYYLTTLWTSAGPVLPLLIALFVVGSLVEPVLGGSVLVYVLAHSVLPHKEFRFLVPCYPVFGAVAAIGAERLLRRLRSVRVVNVLGLGSALASTALFAFLLVRMDYEDMGQYAGTERAASSVWKSEQETSLLLADAGVQPDLCGLAVLGARAAFTGGYTYLHRDVPLIYEGELCSAGPVNYVIAPVARGPHLLPNSYQLAKQRGAWALYRREGACRIDQEDDHLLEGARDMGLGRRQAQQASDGSMRFDLVRDAGAFSQGWGHGELLDCDPARWVDAKQAFIDFEFTPAGPQYQLNLQARAHEGATPQRFAIAINGQRIHIGPMSSLPRSYSADVPEGALKSGKNRIELAFARAGRASTSDDRVLAALFRSIELVPKQDDFTINVALTESRRHLVQGFHPSEQAGDMTFAWSEGPVSAIEGTIAWPRSPYVLSTLAEAVPLVPSQQTRVFANDVLVGTLAFTPRWATQRLVIPASALVKGKNRIRFEYEAAVRPAAVNRKLTDQRELAVRFRRIQLTPLLASSQLDVGTAAARPFLLDGWSGDERDGDRSVVWTNDKRASAVLSFKDIDKPVLRLSALGYGPALPSNVTVLLNGKPVGTFAAPESWQNIAIPMPPADYSAAGEIVSFEFERTVKPSSVSKHTNDSRDLALRVDRLWVASEDDVGAINATVRALEPASTAGIATSFGTQP